MIDSSVFRPPKGPGLVDQPQIDCIAVNELGKGSEVSIKQGPAAGRSPSRDQALQRSAKQRAESSGELNEIATAAVGQLLVQFPRRCRARRGNVGTNSKTPWEPS
jgi:hypothetical protein